MEKLLLIPLYLVYVSHQGGRTTTNKLEAGPAAKGRDNEGQMRLSHVCFFGLVATCEFLMLTVPKNIYLRPTAII